MLVPVIMLVVMGLLTAVLLLGDQMASRAAWETTFLVLVPIACVSIIAAMVCDGAFNGPHPYRSIGWAMILGCVAYVPVGIAHHRAHIRKVRRTRKALALANGDPGAVMLADTEEVETTETADVLQMFCYMIFFMGWIGVIWG